MVVVHRRRMRGRDSVLVHHPIREDGGGEVGRAAPYGDARDGHRHRPLRTARCGSTPPVGHRCVGPPHGGCGDDGGRDPASPRRREDRKRILRRGRPVVRIRDFCGGRDGGAGNHKRTSGYVSRIRSSVLIRILCRRNLHPVRGICRQKTCRNYRTRAERAHTSVDAHGRDPRFRLRVHELLPGPGDRHRHHRRPHDNGTDDRKRHHRRPRSPEYREKAYRPCADCKSGTCTGGFDSGETVPIRHRAGPRRACPLPREKVPSDPRGWWRQRPRCGLRPCRPPRQPHLLLRPTDRAPCR